MNKFTDDEIFKMLEDKYEFLNSQKDFSGRIMNITAINNYSNESNKILNDIIFVAYYIPTKEELYLLDTKNIHISNPTTDKSIFLIDIRLLYDNIETQNLYVLQSLISPYQYFNIKYEEIIKYDIFTDKIALLGFNAIKKLIELQNSLGDTLNYFINYIVAQSQQSIENEHYSKEERRQALVDFIANIINLASEEKTKEEYFLQDLTSIEYKALVSIIEESKDKEYYLSISNLVSLYCISRPVYTSLLSKLKDFKIAIVENKGVKGTYINFFNRTYLEALLENK